MDAATKRADRLRAQGRDVDFKELLRLEPDSGTTNIRNTSSAHWERWLGPPRRDAGAAEMQDEKVAQAVDVFAIKARWPSAIGIGVSGAEAQ